MHEAEHRYPDREAHSRLFLGYPRIASICRRSSAIFCGTLLGPHTPGFVAEQRAEIGMILRMFGVGLQFHVEELLAVRRLAVPGGGLLAALAGVLIGRPFLSRLGATAEHIDRERSRLHAELFNTHRA